MNWSEAMRRFDEGKFGIICSSYDEAQILFEKIRTMTRRRPDYTLANYPDWAWNEYHYIAYYTPKDSKGKYHGSADNDFEELKSRVEMKRCPHGVIRFSDITNIIINENEFLAMLSSEDE